MILIVCSFCILSLGPIYISFAISILGFFILKEVLTLSNLYRHSLLFIILPFSTILYLGLLLGNGSETIISNEVLTTVFILSVFSICLILQIGMFFAISVTYVLTSLCLFQLFLFSDFLDQNFSFIYFFVSIIIFSDTGSYIFGKIIGGPKPFKKLSPGKTVSGYFGGIFSCVLLSYFWPNDFGLKHENLVYCGIILAVTVQFGDLLESMFKRKLNIKDSGSFFPGHGGFLDRFDGFIASVFSVYVLSFYII